MTVLSPTETRILCAKCDTDAVFRHLDLGKVNWGHPANAVVESVYLCSKHSEMAAFGHVDNVSWVRKKI
jgi:hypothetical protein